MPHVSDILQCLSFSFWLISLSIMPSKSIHVVANDSFILFYGWVLYCLYFLYPFICWWCLGCFYVLAIVNAAMNIGVQTKNSIVQIVFVFSRYIPRSEIAGSLSNSSFLRNFHAVFHSMEFTLPPTVYTSFLFSTSLPHLLCSFWWQPFWQVWDDISLWFY